MEKAGFRVCKFNVDGVGKGKLDPARIGGVVHEDSSKMLLAFSEPIGVIESNEAELWVIRRDLLIWTRYGNDNLIILGAVYLFPLIA